MTEPTTEPCHDCNGETGRTAYLPGDGTSCLEEYWVPCMACPEGRAYATLMRAEALDA